MWKTKLGICIYESPSGYKVYQNLFYRWLTLGSTALQTVINRRIPQKPVLHYLPILTLMARHYPNPTCLLGLGGAGVPLMLSTNNSSPSLVAIDNSEEVIDIAKRFFMIEKLKNFTVIHDNAMNYVQNSTTIYSHLLVDLYNANHFPPECINELFFSSCRKILAEDGFLAVNLANPQEQWPIFQIIKKYFNQTMVIPIKKSANMIVIASKCKHKKLFLHKIETSKELKRTVWVGSWGCIGDY
ncbi:spermidine synthase [Legionella sp.]|uniref:spermidine synthase n=1 Tax=Legionella sp. TaxID=459 RepID=UPI003CAEDF23